MNIAEVHRTVIEHSPFAYSYQRLLLDSNDNAFDYEVLDLNAAEKLRELHAGAATVQ